MTESSDWVTAVLGLEKPPNNEHVIWSRWTDLKTKTPQGPLQTPHWKGSQNRRVFLHVFRRLEGWSTEVNSLGRVWYIRGCLVTFWMLQHGIYLQVLLPRKRKEGQRGWIKVIRGSLWGKHIITAVPCLYYGELHLRRGYRHTPNQILHYIKMVPSRDIWDSAWTWKGSQELQEPITSRNLLWPPRQDSEFCTCATGFILWLHDNAYSSHIHRNQHSFVSRVLREKNSLPLIQPAEADFWQPVLGSDYGAGKFGFFHCERDCRNAVCHVIDSWDDGEFIHTQNKTSPFHHIHIYPFPHHGQYF